MKKQEKIYVDSGEEQPVDPNTDEQSEKEQEGEDNQVPDEIQPPPIGG